MTARERALVRNSFDGIREAAGPIALLFYGRLFDMEPQLRKLFPADMKAQGEKLMAMFDSIAGGLEEPGSYRGKLRELGARHVSYGVKTADYDALSRAFLWSLAQALESGFPAETRAAWAALLEEVGGEMRAGAEEQTSAG